MTSRAAINIIGATGATYDLVSLGSSDVTSSRVSKGVYQITGTLGLVPYPPIDSGWGYTVNQMDLATDVEIEFEDGVLTVTASKDGMPYDITHMITLHILVPDGIQRDVGNALPALSELDETGRGA
jgi:hypothetical protein